MFEQICACELQELCISVVNRNKIPVVRLKGAAYEIEENPYQNFMDVSRMYPTLKYYAKRSMTFRKTVDFFEDNALIIIGFFFKERYGGKTRNAMDKEKLFSNLVSKFFDWFSDKRREFQMQFNVSEAKKQILESGKRPNSHGGVANLLKTLTKTMEKQGASIQSIAKVQYTVCMQAGIYIPDEFIEDVAVALSVLDGNEKT